MTKVNRLGTSGWGLKTQKFWHPCRQKPCGLQTGQNVCLTSSRQWQPVWQLHMSSAHWYSALQGGAHIDVQLSDKVEEQEASGGSKEQLRPSPLQPHSWCGQFAVPGSSFSGDCVGAKSLNTQQLQVGELQQTTWDCSHVCMCS